MPRTLVFNFKYKHPPEKIWAAIADAKAMDTWMHDMKTDFEPVVGRDFVFHTTPQGDFDGTIRCRVVECTPPRQLTYTWDAPPVLGHLKWTLTPIPGGTHLHLEHSGFMGFKGFLVSIILQFGWWRGMLLAFPRFLKNFNPPLPGSNPALPGGSDQK
jgi:uncharacterized protein YndB with AHSA1/START domain